MLNSFPASTAVSEPSPQLPLIYILGNSHSGSTLLSFLLSFHPGIINLGELKSKTWLKVRFCSCGQPVETCRFYQDYFTDFNKQKEPAMEKIRRINPFQFLFRKNITPDSDSLARLKAFYHGLQHRVRGQYPESRFIVDSSKSLWLLNAWTQVLPADQIKILWLRRQTKANVASFVKRGNPFLKSLLMVITNNLITRHYLRRHRLTFLEVNYDRFYDAYASEALRMSAYLGVELPRTNAFHQNHHSISGNAKTRHAFTHNFTGLHKDEEWKHILSGPQKKIISWIS